MEFMQHELPFWYHIWRDENFFDLVKHLKVTEEIIRDLKIHLKSCYSWNIFNFQWCTLYL